MRKTSGQALVEFVLILPVFLLLVFACIDFGTIIYEKYRLQNHLDVVKELHDTSQEQEMNRYLNENKLSISYDFTQRYTTIVLSKEINIITPGLNQVLKSPYVVKERLTILNATEP